MNATLKEFRDFLLSGNILELAIAFIMAGAFAAVVGAVVNGFVEPVISMLGGKPDLSSEYFTINDARFGWGLILTAILNLIITGAAVFFLILRPVKILLARGAKPAPLAPEPVAAPLSPEAKRFIEEMTAAIQRLS